VLPVLFEGETKAVIELATVHRFTDVYEPCQAKEFTSMGKAAQRLNTSQPAITFGTARKVRR
jgi:hypothetical protein